VGLAFHAACGTGRWRGGVAGGVHHRTPVGRARGAAGPGAASLGRGCCPVRRGGRCASTRPQRGRACPFLWTDPGFAASCSDGVGHRPHRPGGPCQAAHGMGRAPLPTAEQGREPALAHADSTAPPCGQPGAYGLPHLGRAAGLAACGRCAAPGRGRAAGAGPGPGRCPRGPCLAATARAVCVDLRAARPTHCCGAPAAA
jgi:hypothetical protein